MNDTGPIPPSNAEKRLGTAHFALAAVVALGLGDLAVRWAWSGDWERMAHTGLASYVALALGFDYLVWAAICAWQWGERLRAGKQLAGQELRWVALAHALVLGAAAWVMLRGSDSAALFAGLDRLVATLAVTAALALGVILATWWRGARNVNARPSSRAAVILLAASAGVVASLLWLEYA